METTALTLKRFNQIESIFHTMSIYRSLILYDRDDEYEELANILLENDYTIIREQETEGRMYAIHIDKHNADAWQGIEWDSISLVICLGGRACDAAKQHISSIQTPNFVVMIKI